MLLKTVLNGLGETWFVFADVLTPTMSRNPLQINQVEQSPKKNCNLKCIEPFPQSHQESQHFHTTGEVGDVKHLNEPSKGHHDNTTLHSSSVTGNHLNKPSEGHHLSSVVQPSQELLEDCENAVKNLDTGRELMLQMKGNKINVPEILSKECEIDDIGIPVKALVTRKRKKNDASNHDLSAFQLPNNVQQLAQPNPLSIEKDIEEDNGFIESEKSAKRRRKNESKQESRKNEEEDVPLKLQEIAKKRKSKREKKPGIKCQDLSSERKNDVQNVEPNNISRLGESVETMSIVLNETRNRSDVFDRDPSLFLANEQLDEVNMGVDPLLTVIQSDKRKRKSRKKNPQSDGKTKETNALKEVEQGDCQINNDSLNLVEREKESKENVSLKSEITTKKQKKSKAKSSDAQDLSSKIENDDQNGSNVANSRGELLVQDAVNESDERVETISGKAKKKSRNKKDLLAKDPLESLVEEQPHVEVRETTAPISVIQTDEPKSSQNKQHFLSKDISSLYETMMEKDTPKIVAQMEENLTGRDTNDAPLKSKFIVKKRKTDDSEVESEKTAKEVLVPNLDNVPKLLSQHNSLNLVEKKNEIPADSFKSQNTAKKMKNSNAKSSVVDDLNAEYINRPEESVETMSSKLKKSSKKRKQMKQYVPEKDLGSVNLQFDEASMEMVAHERDETRQDELGENYRQEVSSNFAVKHLEKPPPNKHKAKKLDQGSFVDTSSNGHKVVQSKKVSDSAKTNSHQKHFTEHEHSKDSSPLKDLLTPANAITSRKAGGSRESVNEGGKVLDANFTMETDSSKMVEHTDDILTENKSIDGQNEKRMPQGEDDFVQFSQALHLEVSPALPDAIPLTELCTRKEKTKKIDPPSSVDMSSSGDHSVRSSREIAKTSVLSKSIIEQKHNNLMPPPRAKGSKGPIETPGKNDVPSRSMTNVSESFEASSSSSGSVIRKIRKTEKTKIPPKKGAINANSKTSSRAIETKTVNTSVQKKGLLASSKPIFEDGSSSSSDDYDTNDERTNPSSSSTTMAPDSSSSSDYSEGESKDAGESKYDSPKGNGWSKVNLSGFKLETILRSSSRYKMAHLAASRNQDESQPLDFVPDSQSDL